MNKQEKWYEPFVQSDARSPPPSARAPSRVLLAEDDADLRDILAEALVKDGYEVMCACDGLEMLERLQDALELPLTMPDIIVMDFVMPRYSGLGVLSALRRANWFTPVIMMSGAADESVREKARVLGAAAFLRKPFDIDDLRTAVVNAALLSARAKAVDGEV
jgi:DNA-binding response OmpR family regulator